jgi:hypothetical protein
METLLRWLWLAQMAVFRWAVLHARSRFLIVCAGRRVGKTRLAIEWLAKKIRTGREHGMGVYLAPRRSMARICAWESAKLALRDYKPFEGGQFLVERYAGNRHLRVEGANISYERLSELLSRADYVAVDEADYVGEVAMEMVFDRGGFQVLVLSTPRSRYGKFYEAFNAAWPWPIAFLFKGLMAKWRVSSWYWARKVSGMSRELKAQEWDGQFLGE